jgi:hypothetical protein
VRIVVRVTGNQKGFVDLDASAHAVQRKCISVFKDTAAIISYTLPVPQNWLQCWDNERVTVGSSRPASILPPSFGAGVFQLKQSFSRGIHEHI